jgi:ABC-type sulfate/molybdate transport systems ATPase subunit
MTGLSVRGLTLARPGTRAAAPVLEDISFSAPRGAITAVLGAAGAGKTLLLAGIAGLVKPVRGAVLVHGADVTPLRGARRAIGLLPPGTDLGEGRTVAASLRNAAGRAHAGSITALLPALGLDGLAERRLRDLTHGQGFAVLAAARLLAGGDVLLVDEAASGLADAAREGCWRWLDEVAGGGRTIVLATREAATAARAAHVVLLHRGTVAQTGAPDSLYAVPRDAIAAKLTGPANILSGTVRQKLPGGFVWAAGGGKFRQLINDSAPVPPLAGAVTLCLRPAALHVVQGATPELNRLPGTLRQVRSLGGAAAILVDTALGPMEAAAPHGMAGHAGQPVELAWAPGAATILSPIVE